MKKLIFIIIPFIAIGCSERQKRPVPFPELYANETEWVTYEGVLAYEDGTDVGVELSLLPGAVGSDSYYKMIEGTSEWSRSYGGFYSTLFGSGNHNITVVLHDVPADPPRFNKNGRLKWKDTGRTMKRHFTTNEPGQLIPFTRSHRPDPTDSRYNLSKRLDLFTIEGYITFTADTAEFFERNTRENWAVAKLGRYEEARERYLASAKERYEGVYLKALAYSVEAIAPGNNSEALVVKCIYEMAEDETPD